MSRVLKRPMFKMGGSTSSGITSGMKRTGYDNGGDVNWDEVNVLKEQLLKQYGTAPRRSNVYDFLIDFGLNIASTPPQGNIISTAAAAAKEPYGRFIEGKGEDKMADYMAGIAATDKALSAITDIEVANRQTSLLKDKSLKRRIEEGAQEIMKNTNPGEYGSTFSQAYGLSQGQAYISDKIQETGGAVNMGVAQMTSKDDGTFAPDYSNLLPNKIWWDPDRKQWFTIKIDVNAKTAVPTYHNSDEEAFAALGKVTVTEEKETDTGTGTGSETETETETEEWKDSKWRVLPEDKSKAFSEWWADTTSQEGSTGEADIQLDDNINLKAIVKNEQKKKNIEKDYSELDKWWKSNTQYNNWNKYNLGN